jgi:uncharacterized damage-inducible protein DinB
MGPGVSGSDRVRAAYPDWAQHASRLARGVRSLTAEQLALRIAPSHAPIWALAAHAAGTRVYWLCGVFGEPGAEPTPFSPPFEEGWEDDESHPRSGEELGWALDSTWGVIEGCLDRWTVDDLAVTFDRTYGGITVTHTRASVLNRLFTHDAFHAGEISQLLGANGLPEIDLWRRPRPDD